MIKADQVVKGLATKFHETVKKVMTESFDGKVFDGKEAAGLYSSICNEVEHDLIKEIEKYYPVGTSLTEALPQWKGYKSIYKNGMLMGINPQDYETYSKFKTAKLEHGKDTGGTSNATTSSSLDNSSASQDSGVTSNVAQIAPATSNLPDKVQVRLALAIEALTKLADSSEESALEVLANFEGALRSKLRHNPRMQAL